MEVSLASGERATITSVVREHLVSPVDVYNFQVADFHTYFVASAGVWVHNACMGRGARQAKYAEIVADDKVSRSIRGMLKTRYKQKGYYAFPKKMRGVWELAHARGREARKGFNYMYSKLNLKSLHRKQHAVEAAFRRFRRGGY